MTHESLDDLGIPWGITQARRMLEAAVRLRGGGTVKELNVTTTMVTGLWIKPVPQCAPHLREWVDIQMLETLFWEASSNKFYRTTWNGWWRGERTEIRL